MKMLKIIGIIVLIIVLGLAVFVFISSRPITKATAIKNIQGLADYGVSKNDTITGALIHVDSGQYDIQQTFTAGNMTSDQPFHIASVGKVFTATLIGKYIDDGILTLDSRVSDHLADTVLAGQFVYEGIDYANEVTVGQLLNHTSGAPDYFGDPVTSGKTLTDLVLENPDQMWSPMDLLTFSREHQTAVGKPGESMHYSDNNYILLGLLLEALSEKPFHQLLDEVIFTPLEMDDTYLMFYQEPHNPKRAMADVFLNGTNIKDYASLSIDWAGGGIVSTADDLATFIRALNDGAIIRQETLEIMCTFEHKYMQGIHYGYGFMTYAFSEYFPTLKTLGSYWGHMGVLGTQMFYEKETDTVYIASYGSTDASALSVQDMIKVISFLKRVQ